MTQVIDSNRILLLDYNDVIIISFILYLGCSYTLFLFLPEESV
jgi:hypothetical protein